MAHKPKPRPKRLLRPSSEKETSFTKTRVSPGSGNNDSGESYWSILTDIDRLSNLATFLESREFDDEARLCHAYIALLSTKPRLSVCEIFYLLIAILNERPLAEASTDTLANVLALLRIGASNLHLNQKLMVSIKNEGIFEDDLTDERQKDRVYAHRGNWTIVLANWMPSLDDTALAEGRLRFLPSVVDPFTNEPIVEQRSSQVVSVAVEDPSEEDQDAADERTPTMNEGTVFSPADKIICGALLLIVSIFGGAIWSLNGTLVTTLNDQNDALVGALREQNTTLANELREIRTEARNDRDLYLNRLESRLDDFDDKLDRLQ